MSDMNLREEDERKEIPVTLRLKKNVAEVAEIFAKCYNGNRNGDFDEFISEQITNIIFVLAAAPPTPPEFPDSLKQHIRNILREGKEETKESENEEI